MLRCNLRAGTGERKVECRAGHSHGFKNYKGMRIYEDDALKNEDLIATIRIALRRYVAKKLKVEHDEWFVGAFNITFLQNTDRAIIMIPV